MKTLIVPTDFSPVAINAMNYAIDMAQAIDASILLLHAYQAPVSYTEAPISPVVTLSLDEVKKSSEERLADLKESVLHITSGKMQVYTESRLGNTIDVVEEVCNEVQPFAIVMGSHGSTGLERLLMGSTTLTVMRHVKYPVIVVPPGTSYKGIKKIGLACDFKNVVESTPVEYIKNIVQEFKAELHILNVDYNYVHYHKDTPMESAWLDTMLGDIKPNYYFLNREDVVEGINEFAETSNLDVVMVIPKKHHLLESIFQKSRSKELLSHSHIPIVSIHE